MEPDTKIYTSKNIIYKKKKVSEYSCIQKDETIIKAGSEYIWLWVAIIEPKDKEILGMSISKERNMFVASERFLSSIVDEYGQHTVSTDRGTCILKHVNS